MSWSTSELRVRLAPLNRFKPSSKISYWPFQGGTSFVDLLCFCSVLCLLCLCARLFICALWSPAGKGLTSWLSFVVSTVSLSLSHWYPGSGVVLDCIDSWSLHPYLLWDDLYISFSLPSNRTIIYVYFVLYFSIYKWNKYFYHFHGLLVIILITFWIKKKYIALLSFSMEIKKTEQSVSAF